VKSNVRIFLVAAVPLKIFSYFSWAQLIPPDATKVSPALTREFLDLICPGDAGAIDQVSFVPVPKPPEVRITVTARLGKAVIPGKILEACYTGIPATPAIATISLRYRFVFDGR
jgi:hypothetical protein